jgi:hypothetical protein
VTACSSKIQEQLIIKFYPDPGDLRVPEVKEVWEVGLFVRGAQSILVTQFYLVVVSDSVTFVQRNSLGVLLAKYDSLFLP